jgi:adenine deaminase
MMPPICLVTDDLAPDAVVWKGHLDHVAARAVAAGLPVLQALRAITYTPAQRLRLFDRGTVSPGKRADLVLLDDLASFTPSLVLAGGRVVAREGRLLDEAPRVEGDGTFDDSVHLAPLGADEFQWRIEAPDGQLRLRAIRINPVDTSTEFDEVSLAVRDGNVAWEGQTPLLTVWGRHVASAGTRTVAPVQGMPLGPDGAIASTYAHDSHNLIVLGTSRTAMVTAANAVIAARGGIAVARGDRVVAELPLPIGGLMSVAEPADVARQAAAVRSALEAWGYRHTNVFMSMSSMTLPVSPKLKLTNLGLVEVQGRAWSDPLV